MRIANLKKAVWGLMAFAASFDLDAIERGSRCAAKEAAAAGLHWTFAPMVDISWDARWGRVMEGAGEDPYYGSLVAKADNASAPPSRIAANVLGIRI